MKKGKPSMSTRFFLQYTSHITTSQEGANVKGTHIGLNKHR